MAADLTRRMVSMPQHAAVGLGGRPCCAGPGRLGGGPARRDAVGPVPDRETPGLRRPGRNLHRYGDRRAIGRRTADRLSGPGEGQARPGEVRFRSATAPGRRQGGGRGDPRDKTRLAVYAVQEQGFVVAARSGTTVWILAPPTVAGLEKLVDQNLAAGTAPVATTPEVRVPMYLDRWDKYGFRFYYGPFVKPQDADHREVATYDPRQDFAFAKQSGDVGLVVWNSPFGVPMADGILDFNSRDWVFKAAPNSNCPWA